MNNYSVGLDKLVVSVNVPIMKMKTGMIVGKPNKYALNLIIN